MKNLRLLSSRPAPKGPPIPIQQDSTRADPIGEHLRVRAQSIATVAGKAAPLPSLEEAKTIIAAYEAEQERIRRG